MAIVSGSWRTLAQPPVPSSRQTGFPFRPHLLFRPRHRFWSNVPRHHELPLFVSILAIHDAQGQRAVCFDLLCIAPALALGGQVEADRAQVACLDRLE